ncbi:MAG TPA: HEPN domain-containing protein [Planctomycetota bacterium]|nr:HEPN domain-containing protein [Planctomycetota bacterium]
MPPEKPVERWRRKAADDLRAAETLLRASDPPIPYGLVCFLAQPAAEKHLKGWLVSRGLAATRTHDLESLVRRASTLEPRFEVLRDLAARLRPFAVAPRYPGDVPEPGEHEAKRAIERAKAIRDFVDGLGPAPPEQALPLGGEV